MVTKSREKLIREKNKISKDLNPLSNDVVWSLINSKGHVIDSKQVSELLYRLAVEVQYMRLDKKLYS